MRTNQPCGTDHELIDTIRTGGQAREKAWLCISNHWGGYCGGTAKKVTGCTREQAVEAFSIAVVGVDIRIRTTTGYDFLGIASLKTYLAKSTIHAAIAIMRRAGKYTDLDGEENIWPGEDLNKWFDRANCREIMEKALSGIGDRCKKILLLFNDGFNMDDIAEAMGFADRDSAKKEKHKCQVKFKNYLDANADIKNLLENTCYG